MQPRDMSRRAVNAHQIVTQVVLPQEPCVAGAIKDGATAMPMPARRPTVISSVPGTEYGAVLSISLRSRLVSAAASEAGARRRGRRGQ